MILNRVMNSKLCLVSMALLAAVSAAQKDPKAKKTAGVTLGVKTPGVQIPYASLKSDADIVLDSPVTGLAFTDAAWMGNASAIHKIDAKTNKPPEPAVNIPAEKVCGGMVNAFAHLWVAACGSKSLLKVDVPAPPAPPGGRGGRGPASPDGPPPGPKPEKAEAAAAPAPEAPKPAPAKPAGPPKIAATLAGVSPAASSAMAASDDSIWLLADNKTALQRIDPKENQIVAEMRLPGGCSSILYAETALWVTCPGEPKLLRIDPRTNLVDKRIDVPAEPVALAAGDGSVWVLCRKEGKVVRIDPKTNKVSATVELAVPGASGTMAFGEGSLWVSIPGFPLARIGTTAEKEKVLQQFTGEGGGLVQFGLNSLWLTSAGSNTVVRFDPKRVIATLAE